MTKRYNLFNYGITWLGILLIVFFTFVFGAVIYYFILKAEDLSLLLRIGLSSFCLVLYVYAVLNLPRQMIREGMKKAYHCEGGYLYGRVRADEDTKRFILNLDWLNALYYCNNKECKQCPYRVSCFRTQYDWIFECASRAFKNLEPDSDTEHFLEVIDRYMKCERTACSIDCHYSDDCIELNPDEYRRKIYDYFIHKGISSATQLKK